MEELLLVNPRKRRAKSPKRRRTAAQRRATAKMIAANRSRRRSNPVSALANPRKRRTRRRNPVAANPRRTRRYRRNPIGGNITNMLTASVQGAAGAMVVNAAYNFLPLPDMLKTGVMSSVTKGALAVGLGMFGGKVLPGRVAAEMAKGALTVTMYDALKGVVDGVVSGLGYYTGGMTFPDVAALSVARTPAPQLSEYVNMPAFERAGVSEYMSEY